MILTDSGTFVAYGSLLFIGPLMLGDVSYRIPFAAGPGLIVLETFSF